MMPEHRPDSVQPRPRRRSATPADAQASADDDKVIELSNGRSAFSAEWRSPEHQRYVHAIEEVEAARKRLYERHRDLDPTVSEWERRSRWLTAVWQEGLGYQAGAPEGVSIGLSRLREQRGELTAEIAVRREGMHLLQQRINLSSGQARSATAKALAGHPFGGEGPGRNPIDWREILEQLSLKVLELERAGEDFEHVGTLPPQPSPPRIMDPYLPAGPTLMWAPQGVGKSTIAAAIVVSLETFTEVLPGWHPMTEARCLVLDWEASPGEWNNRLARISAGVGIAPPSVLYRRPRRPLAELMESTAAVVDREQIGYLVIDSVEKAAGARAEGSTYEEKAERLFLAIDRIGVPCLLIDHVTGDDLRHGGARVTPKSIGSVLKGAWARATYDLKRDPETSTESAVQMLMTNVKVNDARRERPYEFAIRYEGDEHSGPIRFERSRLDSPELLAALPQADQMWRVLVRDGAQSVKAIAEALDTSQATIRTIILRDSRREHPRFVRLPDGSIAVRQSEEV